MGITPVSKKYSVVTGTIIPSSFYLEYTALAFRYLLCFFLFSLEGLNMLADFG